MNPLFASTGGRRCAMALALCAAQAAFAQSEAGPPHPGLAAQATLLGGPSRHEMLFLAGAQLERERIVQGAPYCADAIHESVQTLADGNRIVQRQSSRQCRDEQGRTRQEVLAGGRRNVYLRDPIAQEAWLLDAEGRQAIRLDPPRRGPAAEDASGPWGRLLGWGRDLRDRFRSHPADAAAPGAPEGPEPMRIFIGGPPGAEMPPPRGPMPPPVALHTRLLAPRGAGVVTLLPGETIEGLRADGKRTTWTIDAGKIGNEKPIVIVNEVWSSPDLGITLRSRDADPMLGEQDFRVQNIARGEPDPALFRVPADFRKVTPPGPGGGPGKR